MEPQPTVALNCHELQAVALIKCMLLLLLVLLLPLPWLLLPRCRTACAEAVHVLNLYCCVASSIRRLLYCTSIAAAALCAWTGAVRATTFRYCFQGRMQAAAVLLLLLLMWMLPRGLLLLLLVHVLV